MYVIAIELCSMRDDEQVSGCVCVEERFGNSWKRMEAFPVLSGDPSAARRLVLKDNQRLVVEASSNTKVVYDAKQNAAVLVRVPDEMVEQQLELQHVAEAREAELAEHRRLLALDRAKRRLGANGA